jgi:AAHS family 3-hydroxyphenylpropionic acid transporter
MLLWVTFFFTLLVLYMMLNWLPTLLEVRGIARAQSLQIAMAFNLGGVAGALTFGWLLGRIRQLLALSMLFSGMVLGILALAFSKELWAIGLAALMIGFFLVAGQFVLYGLAPRLYPSPVRGTGVGAAVAVGRLGSILGPLLAGLLLAGGGSPTIVLLAVLPVVALAGAAALLLPDQAATIA